MRFHPKAVNLIAGKSYKEARRILRDFGCTHAEQNQVIHAAKQLGVLKIESIKPGNITT